MTIIHAPCVICHAPAFDTRELHTDIRLHGAGTIKAGDTVPLCFPCISALFTLTGPEYEARRAGRTYVVPGRE